ncbi:MAG: response regulator [Thermodesulfobacteriota bacterium]
MSILIVDNSVQHRILLQHILRSEGFPELLEAGTAKEALDLLGLGDPGFSTDVKLILMDLLTPEMNGIEACRLLKADENLRDIPLIMVTGVSDQGNLEAAFEAGAADYIVKPVNKVELVARVRSLLRLKYEMDMRKARERELEETVARLREAMAEVKQLSGLLPICAHCKKIRDDEGYWQQVEIYLQNHSQAQFSHGICPDCLKSKFPKYADRILKKTPNR